MTTSRNLIMARALLDQFIEEMDREDPVTVPHHADIMRMLPAFASGLQVRLILGLIMADGKIVRDGQCHALMDAAPAPYPEPEDGWTEVDCARLRMMTRRIQIALKPLGFANCIVRHRGQGYSWDWGKRTKGSGVNG